MIVSTPRLDRPWIGQTINERGAPVTHPNIAELANAEVVDLTAALQGILIKLSDTVHEEKAAQLKARPDEHYTRGRK